ncbi:hypothetical protein O1611_g727 [Lasiodiplodia mahajangana]|uniref:Uncharacterized protein n=1 Tax=Lasiodiplodia mahajangana TaxID=1108764 RepID=A0ACC2JZS4_9PEZI|nr:hypothetical protein O1611_g727 [Lasiodiplodia mahajangana]
MKSYSKIRGIPLYKHSSLSKQPKRESEKKTIVSVQGVPQPNATYGTQQMSSFSGISITGNNHVIGNSTGIKSNFENIVINGNGLVIGNHTPDVIKSFWGFPSASQRQTHGHETYHNGGRHSAVPNSNHGSPGEGRDTAGNKSGKMVQDKPYIEEKADKMDTDSDDEWEITEG